MPGNGKSLYSQVLSLFVRRDIYGKAGIAIRQRRQYVNLDPSCSDEWPETNPLIGLDCNKRSKKEYVSYSTLSKSGRVTHGIDQTSPNRGRANLGF
jgi:hypothetical protein